MTDPIVRVESLTKTYGKDRGVEDVSFDVRRGEVFGFLGPNGAGKTTTIRVMLDLLRPTRGRVEVFGMDATTDAPRIHARVGYVPGEQGLADRLTAGEQLKHLAHLKGGVPWARVEGLARRFELDLHRPVRQMSRGNKQKVGILAAFMHEPELLVLDEPTSGLDPLMQQEFNKLVRETRASGRTVFLSTHILPEVEVLCDRVGVIREGRLVTVEDVATFRDRAVRHARIELAGMADVKALDGVPGVSDVSAVDHELTCSVRGPTGALLKALAKLDVLDFATREPSIEEVFLAMYADPSDPRKEARR